MFFIKSSRNMLKNKKPDKMLKFKNKPGQNRIASVIILLKKILTKIIYYTKIKY